MNPSPLPGAPRLGELLQQRGLINEDQLCVALMEQNRSGHRLGAVLTAMGFVSEAIVRDALGECLGQESIDLETSVVDPRALAMVPVQLARRHRVLPVAWDEDQSCLHLAMADPTDLPAQDRIAAAVGRGIRLQVLVASVASMDEAIERCYGFDNSINAIIQELEAGSGAMDSGDRSHPVVRLVDALLADAVRRDASDIHLEPEQGFLRLRYRIDGVLRQIRALHSDYWPGISVRIKLLAGMNIAESRTPQDGRISITICGRAVDFRVATMPVLQGENIVLRVLDRSQGTLSLPQLASDDNTLRTLTTMLSRPEGLILFTGPTGSGKTTSLYAMLSSINDEGRNIMTLEDPVEYPLPMIRQTTVNRAVKMDFASGVRALLRQDPDAILIGEIRDEATAAMALRAAMTGHQVFATLHCNFSLGAAARLEDFGVRRELLAGNITGIVAQRLVRKLCRHCRRPEPLDTLLQMYPELRESRRLPGTIFSAQGCSRCERQGYRGRMALMETLLFDEQLDQMLLDMAGRRDMEQYAKENGFVPLAVNALQAVLDGKTSLAEISRVVNLRSTRERYREGLGV